MNAKNIARQSDRQTTRLATRHSAKRSDMAAEEVSVVGAILERVMGKVNEQNERFREAERAATNECFSFLAEKLEAIQITQAKSLEAQRMIIKTPLPKYNGKAGEFDDWKEGVLNCIKNNDWTDEKRTLEMLPSCLSGQARVVFKALSDTQKSSLDAVFAALKEALDPASKSYNREMFLRARRTHGESMHSFVSRCNQYIKRAEDIDSVDESPWANPFIVEKIFANLNNTDRKILKISAGKTEDVKILCSKADELLLMSEDVVGSLDWERTNKRWRGQRPKYGGEVCYDMSQTPPCQDQHQRFDQRQHHQPNNYPYETQEVRPGGEECQMEHHELVSWNDQQTSHMSRPGGEACYDMGQTPPCQNQHQCFDQHQYHQPNDYPYETQEFRPGGEECQTEHPEWISWNNQQTSHMSGPGGENFHGDCYAIDDAEEEDDQLEEEEDKKMEVLKISGEGEGIGIDSPQLHATTATFTDHGELGETCTHEQTAKNPIEKGGNSVSKV